MEYTITIHTISGTQKKKVKAGTNLLDFYTMNQLVFIPPVAAKELAVNAV